MYIYRVDRSQEGTAVPVLLPLSLRFIYLFFFFLFPFFSTSLAFGGSNKRVASYNLREISASCIINKEVVNYGLNLREDILVVSQILLNDEIDFSIVEIGIRKGVDKAVNITNQLKVLFILLIYSVVFMHVGVEL